MPTSIAPSSLASSKTRIAIAGAGLIGTAHARVLADSADCVLCAFVDPSPGAAQVAQEAGVPLYNSLQALFAHERPEGVVLATPNALHVAQALECLAAGVSVLVEKPIATTSEEALPLLHAAERYAAQGGPKVLIGHHRAHSPIMQKAREVVTSGQLGEVVAVSGSALFFKPESYFEQGPWRTQPGGGPILLNMIHEVHNLRMLCGEIVAVQAMASNARRGFAVEDTVVLTLQFAKGALGTFVLSDTAASPYSWEQTSQENKAYASYPQEDCYQIAGTMGSLSVPTLQMYRYSDPSSRSWWTPFETQLIDLKREDPLRLQMAHFGEVVRGQAQPLVSAADGLANLRVTEAIVAAAQSGQRVELPKYQT